MASVISAGAQVPYAIYGTVTVNGSLYQGAKVWLRDITDTGIPAPVDDITVFFTNASGEYLIDLANCTLAYANADTVYVYCQVGDEPPKRATVTVSTTTGYSSQNFTFTLNLVDGLKASILATGKGTLYPGTIRFLNDGLAE